MASAEICLSASVTLIAFDGRPSIKIFTLSFPRKSTFPSASKLTDGILPKTSLTVPRIRYVIDPGFARIKRYSPRQKLDRLHIEPISQASANQRQGRCGRIASGICYRLYSEADFQSRPEYTDPEILRASLSGVILRMLSLGLGRLEDFPFIDAPDSKAIADGWQQLTELGAVLSEST